MDRKPKQHTISQVKSHSRREKERKRTFTAYAAHARLLWLLAHDKFIFSVYGRHRGV